MDTLSSQLARIRNPLGCVVPWRFLLPHQKSDPLVLQVREYQLDRRLLLDSEAYDELASTRLHTIVGLA